MRSFIRNILKFLDVWLSMSDPVLKNFILRPKKSSLAFYLNECELESKMDMPFHRIMEIH